MRERLIRERESINFRWIKRRKTKKWRVTKL